MARTLLLLALVLFGAAAYASDPASDPRCRVTEYQLGDDVLRVIYSDHDAFWERYPDFKPRFITDHEAELRGLDPMSLEWTTGLYDPATDVIWIVGRFDHAKNLRHEIAHHQMTHHGWDVARWYWLRCWYQDGRVGHDDDYRRLCEERMMGLSWYGVPAIVTEHTKDAVLVNGIPPESGQVIGWVSR